MNATDVKELADGIRREVGRAIVGQDDAVELMLIALLASGHILLEGPPGTYSRTTPALVMVGHWGLSFQVEPNGSAPFTVIVEDKAEG